MKALEALPQIDVLVAGAALSDRHMLSLFTMLVRQRLSTPTQCELLFRDTPDAHELTGLLRPGVELELKVHGPDESLFHGQVTAVEHVFEAAAARQVRARAYDLSHRMRKRQQVRAHVQVSPRSLAQDLAEPAGLTVRGSFEAPVWPRLIQHRQTDLELLVEVLDSCGLYYTVQGRELTLLTLEGHGSPISLTLGHDLLEARIVVNADRSTRKVETAGWNPLDSSIHSGSVSTARSGREVVARVLPQDVGGAETRTLVDLALLDDRHAEAVAQAELDHRAASQVTIRGVAEGRPSLRPGAIVDVQGVGRELSGRYVLTGVTHTIGADQGFLSSFESDPPRTLPPRRAAIVTSGVVSRLDDPERKGRMRVTLPTYDHVETEWMNVLCLTGGVGKGLVVMPDVGDQVLVLMAAEDPCQGVVLGAVYGSGAMPDDAGVEDGKVRRYTLLTPGGLKVRLDDTKQSITLEDATGSFLNLAAAGVHLNATVDLEISAPGRRVVIRGQAIDFESA
jgi:phage protein D/phage baseplate assembly protein gpV